jgi:hypothetical protein
MPLFKDFPTPKAGGRDSDVVGSVRTGRLDERTNRPYSLDTLRFTADHMDIVTKIAELYGGTPGEWSTTKSDRYEVITEAAAVNFELRTFDVEFILYLRHLVGARDLHTSSHVNYWLNDCATGWNDWSHTF